MKQGRFESGSGPKHPDSDPAGPRINGPLSVQEVLTNNKRYIDAGQGFLDIQLLQECESEMDKRLVYFSGFFLSLYSFLEVGRLYHPF